jgi:hypothetical protein
MTEKHVHKLKRIKYKSGNISFFCTLPDCSYKVNPTLALGKKSICWRCLEEFILTEYSIRLVKPHCVKCHKIKGSHKRDDVIVYHDQHATTELWDGDHAKIEIEKELKPQLTLAERLQMQIKEREEDI